MKPDGTLQHELEAWKLQSDKFRPPTACWDLVLAFPFPLSRALGPAQLASAPGVSLGTPMGRAGVL